MGLKIGGKAKAGGKLKIGGKAKAGGKIKLKLKIGGKAKGKAKKLAAHKWAAGTKCRTDFNLLWNSIYTINSFKGTFKLKTLMCAKALSKFRAQMTCAVCDPTLGDKWKTGMPIDKNGMTDMLEACVPTLYAINTFFKPALLRGLAFVKKVNAKAANLEKIVDSVKAFDFKLDKC